MIKFFRKIRYNLMEQNKTGKYFKYAIGEIVLVVIGILIALSINNSNEKSKAIDSAVNEVENLSQNLYTINSNNSEIYYLQIQDSVLQSFRNNDNTIYPNYTRWYDKNPLKIGNDLQYTMSENFDLVLNLEKSFPNQYKDVIQTIKNTKTVYENTIPSLERMLLIARKNNEILANSYDWYDDYSEEALVKRHQYFIKDSLFQNRLFEYIQNFKEYASQANRLRMLKAKIWLETQIINPNKTLEEIKIGLNKMNLSELFAENCSYKFKRNKLPSFFIWNLIYNSTNDTIPIATWDSNEPTFYLEPKQVNVFSGRINNGIKIFQNGKCSIKYNNLINGYLILE